MVYVMSALLWTMCVTYYSSALPITGTLIRTAVPMCTNVHNMIIGTVQLIHVTHKSLYKVTTGIIYEHYKMNTIVPL